MEGFTPAEMARLKAYRHAVKMNFYLDFLPRVPCGAECSDVRPTIHGQRCMNCGRYQAPKKGE